MNLSAKDKRILKKLTEKLPKFPMPGWDRERILCELGLDDEEGNWRKILKVIFKARRGVELREPNLPVIKWVDRDTSSWALDW